MAKAKGRNFAFILYPDSLPEGWKEKLEDLGMPMAISPLHDKDVKEVKNPLDLTDYEAELYNLGRLFKKPHYHVMYIAPNPVTIDGVRNKIKRKLGDNTVSHVEIVDNVEGYYQYLTHESKDAIRKKKVKYDKNDIVHLCNFDIDRYITMDDIQKKELFNAITKVVITEKLENIFDLTDFVMAKGDTIGVPTLDVMNDVIAPRTSLLRMYFDGAYQRRKNGTCVKLEERIKEERTKEVDK